MENITNASSRSKNGENNAENGTGHLTIEPLIVNQDIHPVRTYAKATLEPQASVGYHIHEGEYESYYILSGEGMYNDNGTEIPIKAGDVTFTGDGKGHGIRNTGTGNMEFIALIVRI